MGLIQNKVTVSQPNSHVVVKNAGGLRGLTGETGPQGPQGVPGEAATVTAGTTTTLPAGSDATVQNVGSTSAAIFNFGIPKGDKGDTGETGAAATISVGSTSTLPAGSSATVTNSGTSSAAVFDFGIPKGDKGDTGATGADGFSPTATVTKTGDTATITITDKDGTTTASISDGSTPTVNDGTLTIQKNGTTVQTFSADQASNVTANITVPTQFSELSGTVSSSQIEDEAITTGSVSGTGTNITLAGTMEGGAIESVELNGDTQQTTYSGKNLFDVTRPSTWTGSNTTYSVSDGVLTVSGDWFVGIIVNVVQGTQYYVSATRSDKSGASQAGNMAVYSSGTQLAFLGQNNGTFTAPGSNVTILFYSGAGSTGSCKFSEIQVEAGNAKTSYEPYVGGTASPNPDYPQEVQTVTGEQTVTVVGKNLLNESAMEQGTFSYIDGYESAHTGVIRMDSYMRCQPNTTYTLSSDSVLGEVGVVYKDSSGNVVQGFSKGAETITSYSFTTQPNVYQMRVRVGKGAYPHTAGVDYKLQLELGNQPTSYQPYQGGSYPINLGKNLLNPATLTADSRLNGDGTLLSGATGFSTSDYIPVEPNTTYTITRNAASSGFFGNLCQYDSSKTLVGTREYWDNAASNWPYHITTSSTTRYIRVSDQTTLFGTSFQIEKGSVATTYAPYFTPIELCKIGTYQDYIYKSGEDWYVKKNTKKLDMSTINAWARDVAGRFYRVGFSSVYGIAPGVVYSNDFTYSTTTWDGEGKFGLPDSGNIWLMISDTTVTQSDLPTWLGNKGAIMYGVISTPTDTQITNATLISELEGLLSATTYSGTTYITVSGDLASPLEVVAEADSKLAPDSVYGAAIKDGAVSVDKIADLKALADALAPYLNS